MELISLNLIYDYPVYWSKFKVLRDFVQNFYDAISWQEWDRKFTYFLSDGVLQLCAYDIGFSYDWLLHIGASTKREESAKYAGHFGEGFKIASLCSIRDYDWHVEIQSRDWKLSVVSTEIVIDSRYLKSLAYNVEQIDKSIKDTILYISPFYDEEILHNVLLSFYYPSNLLFGQKIWKDSGCAVYFRSNKQKPQNYPCTYDYRGEGIIFAGYQALGSFEFPLIFCLHNYRYYDRERSSFFRMHVLEVIEKVCLKLSSEASVIVLQALKRKWYDRPQKKYDFESWHKIISRLVKNISLSEQQTMIWKEKNPDLLVAPLVKRNNLYDYNRRRQALDWLKVSGKSYRLVQKDFFKLGYPALENVCEKYGGFSITCEPCPEEMRRIKMLEQLVQALFSDMLTEIDLPPCRIIKSDKSAWQGMTEIMKLNDYRVCRGLAIRYQLPYVALKRSLLHPETFGEALSTYLHELAHVFGGDRSAAFSRGLSMMMDVILNDVELIAQYRKSWSFGFETR